MPRPHFKTESPAKATRSTVSDEPADVENLTIEPAPVTIEAPKSAPVEEAKTSTTEKTTADLPESELKNILNNVIRRKFFYSQAFEIYGGIAGLYDYGPVLAAVKRNVINTWIEMFVSGYPDIFEISCTALTPSPVFQASGHVEKFSDLMVRDTTTNECYRADQLLQAHLELLLTDTSLSAEVRSEIEQTISQADAFTSEQMQAAITKYKLKSPAKNDVSEPVPRNLMFKTHIGPLGDVEGYLRPETAQGIFVNFQKLFEFNNHQLPFGVAQVGSAFRNEVSPRAGIIRLREFSMAEIEYFLDPEHHDHHGFMDVCELEVTFLPRETQESTPTHPGITLSIEAALASGYIQTEVMGFFIGRTFEFLTMLGIDADRIRFRQHLNTQMAHYAADCWDAEVKLSSGWTEVTGIADRACYDLSQHSKATGVDLVAFVELDEPIEREVVRFELNKGMVVKHLVSLNLAKSFLQSIEKKMQDFSQSELVELLNHYKNDGKIVLTVDEFAVELTQNHFKKFDSIIEKQTLRRVEPRVIEPSFGLDRIIYCILEHSFYVRPGVMDASSLPRSVFRFEPSIAPYKVVVLPIYKKPHLIEVAKEISSLLTLHCISYRMDTSASIGKRYARADEIGIPFAITIDENTVTTEERLVTVRERDSGEQILVPIDDLVDVLGELIDGCLDWITAKKEFALASANIF
ncbi:hypothetical protein RCL1_003997 [Eukaryota sp. TZLM3-RCL]